jgi:hypothetical protein
MAGRSFNQAFHCQHKHLLNSEMHLIETAQKFQRQPPEEGVDPGTRDELMRAQREIQAIEGHSMEILNKLPDDVPSDKEDKVKDIGDTARKLRQRVEDTGVPFKAEVRPRPDADEVVEDVLDGVKNLQEEVDQFATEFEQEQLDENCVRCEEDLLEALDNIDSGLKTELKSSTAPSVGEDVSTSKPSTNNFLDQLGVSSMVSNMELQSLTIGTFGAKALEEVAGAATDNIGALQELRVGPFDAESTIGLGIGVGVPALELMTDELSGLDSGTRLALNTAALTLLANEVGDLASGVASGSASGSARSATVSRRSTSTGGGGSTSSSTSPSGGVNVGQGNEARSTSSGGLIVG